MSYLIDIIVLLFSSYLIYRGRYISVSLYRDYVTLSSHAQYMYSKRTTDQLITK